MCSPGQTGAANASTRPASATTADAAMNSHNCRCSTKPRVTRGCWLCPGRVPDRFNFEKLEQPPGPWSGRPVIVIGAQDPLQVPGRQPLEVGGCLGTGAGHIDRVDVHV